MPLQQFSVFGYRNKFAKYRTSAIFACMDWVVEFHSEFESEFDRLSEDVQNAIAAKALLLKAIGPQLARPHADTLQGSTFKNMKELRCDAHDGVWRVAFAFDPERRAVLLVAGDKAGTGQKRFYKRLIAKADQRFDRHLKGMGTR